MFFAATGVSDGDLVRGVRFFSGGAATNSVVMRGKSQTGNAMGSMARGSHSTEAMHCRQCSAHKHLSEVEPIKQAGCAKSRSAASAPSALCACTGCQYAAGWNASVADVSSLRCCCRSVQCATSRPSTSGQALSTTLCRRGTSREPSPCQHTTGSPWQVAPLRTST